MVLVFACVVFSGVTEVCSLRLAFRMNVGQTPKLFTRAGRCDVFVVQEDRPIRFDSGAKKVWLAEYYRGPSCHCFIAITKGRQSLCALPAADEKVD